MRILSLFPIGENLILGESLKLGLRKEILQVEIFPTERSFLEIRILFEYHRVINLSDSDSMGKNFDFISPILRRIQI